MKRIFTLLCFCLALNMASAQQTAPDFTVTTVHGEEFNLYTELDKGKTVILDIFFVNCPPCNSIAPFIQDLNVKWGDGDGDVEFISLTDVDTNEEIIPYETLHSLTFPAAGRDAGGTEAVTPYITGTFGQFFGYPTLVVIAPDRTMNYDIWGSSDQNTSDLLDEAIAATGATGEALSVFESNNVSSIKAYPNPVVNDLQVTFDLENSNSINVLVIDATGKLVSETQKGILAAGEQTINIDFSTLSNGTYFVELRNNSTLLSSFNVVK